MKHIILIYTLLIILCANSLAQTHITDLFNQIILRNPGSVMQITDKHVPNITPFYTIKATLKQVSGKRNVGFGLVWQSDGWQNCNVFFITSNGYFFIGEYKKGECRHIVKWQKFNHPPTPDGFNTLIIKQDRFYTSFFINGEHVYTGSASAKFGTKYGYAIRGGIEVSSSLFEIESPKPSSTLVKQKMATISTKASEIAPTESSDGNKLYFSRLEPDDTTKLNIWVSTITGDGQYSSPTKLNAPINSQTDNTLIKAENGTLYLEGNYNKACKYVNNQGITIFSPKNNTYVTQNIQIKDFYNNNILSSYSFGPGNKVLILSLQRDDSYGQLDLYAAFKTGNNTYSQPVNLGSVINTKFNDGTPFLANDNTTLYFSSYGHNSIGSSDIFVTRRLDDTWTNWSQPINIGSQINTQYWDAYLSISADGKRAYMVTSSQDANEDIYSLTIPQEFQPINNYIIKGVVTDNKETPVAAKLTIKNAANNKIINYCYTNNSGQFTITLNTNCDIKIETEAEQCFDQSTKLSIKKDKHIYINNIQLEKIETDVVIKLNNVYFQRGAFNLTPESLTELNRLAILLKKNPTLLITIHGYTAAGFSQATLQQLSENRANAVKQYLISKGIDNSRITTIGHGELTNPNEKEDRKRVEFVITKP